MEKREKKSTVGWLMEWAAPHKGGYVASVILAVIGVVCSIVPYFAVSRILVGLLSGEMAFAFYLEWVLICAAFFVLKCVFHSISTTLSHKATFSVISEVRRRLVLKLARLPMGYLLDTPSGALKNIIVEKVDSIETTLAHVVPEMTSNILVPVAIIGYLFTLDWRMALISLITLPLGLLCYMGMMRGYEEKFGNYVTKNKHLNATAVEYINGIEVIKAFNQSAASYEKFSTAAREAALSAINWMKDSQVYFAIAMSVLPATLVTVLPAGGMFYMNGSLSMENLIQIIILSIGIMPPIVTAFSYTDDLGKISMVVSDIASVLELPDLVRPEKPVKLARYDIVLENVCFGYGKKQVLNDVNLEIEPGTVTALVGPSGGGKSTIAKLIASLWDTDGGSIAIGGVNMKEIPLEQINTMVAYVAQDNYLFDDTVRNNIRMGNPSATDEEVEEAAKASGCHAFIMQLERGYETVAGGAGGHLSGGERQRIAIARAMLKNAPIVILDEATAYTDPENEAVIQSAVAKLVRGKTLIVVAHRLSTITDSDRIVVIKDGGILNKGTHAELLAGCEVYRDMWDAHIGAKDEKEEVPA
ncbi:ABC transporter ATP-binding protein/permease [Christensenellaceae bacterium OttesenSCG-928-M15]|nr:ABC transporter ATP-binding protein/permease [Christensenellaceae bacterium OttesenSCG-928-M15]